MRPTTLSSKLASERRRSKASMKKKRTRQKHNLTQRVLILLTVFILGLILWLNWSDIRNLIPSEQKKLTPKQIAENSREEISEQERRNLDKILKRR